MRNLCLAIAIAVIASVSAPHALGQCSQGPTYSCVTSFSLSPSDIPGNGVNTALGAVAGFVGQGGSRFMVEISGSIGFECIGSTRFYGDQWGPGGCSVPANGPTSASLSVRLYGTNGTASPVTATVSTYAYGMPSTPVFSQQLTLEPNPAATEPPVNDPDGPCDSCPEDGAGPASGGAPINFANGDVWISHQDYSIPGPGGGLSLVRTWNSLWTLKQPIETSGIFGHSWRSNFEERIQVLSGGVVKYWKGNGSLLFYVWNQSSNSYQLTAPLNDSTRLSFDSNTALWTVALKDGTTKLFNSAGYLISIVDRNGNAISIAVDAANQNRISAVTDAAGRVLTFSYGNANFPRLCTSISDAVGTVASYSYDVNGRLTQVVYSDGSQDNFSYDANNLVLNVTDGLGKTLEAHTYDSQRRGLTSKRANNVDLVTVAYGTNGTTTVYDSLFNSSSITHVLVGQRYYTSLISGFGCHTCSFHAPQQQMLLDSSGVYPAKVQDAAGHARYVAYDSQGNLMSKTLQAGTTGVTGYDTWSYTYNSFGEVLTAMDPLGNVTSNTYDPHGNLLTTTTPSPDGFSAGSTTIFTYNSNGTLDTVTDPLGNVTVITYDSNGMISTIEDAQHNVTTYQYDARGNRTAVFDPLNGMANSTSFSYDSMNRLTSITYPGATASVQFHYDYRGRRDYVIDQNGKQTTYAYDDADRMISVTDAQSPTPGVTRYGYDTESNLTDIWDAKNDHTTFTYVNNWKLQRTTFPSGLNEQTTLSNNGVLTYKQDRKSQGISFAPDWQDRIWVKQYPDGSAVYYTYDAAGRLTTVDDPTGTYSFSYDGMGQLKQTTTNYKFDSAGAYTVSYTYDAASNRASMTDPQGGVAQYTYDTLNRLTNLEDAQFQNYGLGYDVLSRRTSLTRPNGVDTAYSYDAQSRLLNVAHQLGATTIDGASYTYDNAGNRTSKTDLRTGVTSNYAYDNIYQLTQVTQGASTSESYTYDLVGNRLSSLGVPSYSYNSSNQLTSNSNATYTYDNNGSTLTKVDSAGTTTYTWDYV